LVTVDATTPINVHGPASDVLLTTPIPSAFEASYSQVNVTGDPFEIDVVFQPGRQMEVMLVCAKHDSIEAETKTINITVITRRFMG
jgi:hypothetical protein